MFDHHSPSPAAEEIVYQAFLDLTRAGAEVIVVAGNHDNGRRFTALKPFMELAKVHALGELARPDDGGCIDLAVGGEVARIARLPWISQRGIIRAAEIMDMDPAGHQQEYQMWMKEIVHRLCERFGNDTVNILVGHITVTGAEIGGGERQAETIFEYWVPPQSLPGNANYCALGHIHRQQRITGAGSTAWYSGSPLQLDFGEKPGGQGVLVFDARPGFPVGEVRQLPLSSGRPLVTVTGTLEQVRTEAARIDANAYVRVVLDEAPRPGLSDAVYSELPNAVRVELKPRDAGTARSDGAHARSPHELYDAYLADRGLESREPLLALFDELAEEAQHAPA